MPGAFNINVATKVNGNEVAILLSEMAQRLDAANDLVQMKDVQISILERQAAILSEDVTLEGNNV